ncbi:MAG: hypothetical protein L6R00_15060 [Phycisphaerae bacterium]|nr:hypothetical protein [Phycisphaerae bacterium]
MTPRELQDALRDLLEAVLFARDDADDPAGELAEHVAGIRQIATYDDVGIPAKAGITRDKGLIIETRDGAEFQLTIVQSRPAAQVGGQEDKQ